MEQLIDRFKELDMQNFSFESLGEFVYKLNYLKSDYKKLLGELPDSSTYIRKVIQEDPIELVLIYWPPGKESAIHYHHGFYGYVVALEGKLDNVEYNFNGKELIEKRTTRACRGGILNEPDGVIHKLKNNGSEPAVTLHIYYPPLKSFDDMVIYSEKGELAVLNDKAKTASFKEPKEHFKSYKKGAFDYLSYADKNSNSHRVYPVIPKPSGDKIKEMLTDYYAEQAHKYDLFDLNHESRNNYTQRINKIIAHDLKRKEVLDKELVIACGTGRRAKDIQKKSGRKYDIYGVDISEEMCEIANSRGLFTKCGDFLDMRITEKFDVATFLYSFGHIPSAEERLRFLMKLQGALNKDGVLYLDVFNLHDENEWGPSALKLFQDRGLHNFGYERGDVFYKKVNGESIAYLHYFAEKEIEALLIQAGFEVEWIQHIGYVHRSGELLADKNGALFVKAVKKF